MYENNKGYLFLNLRNLTILIASIKNHKLTKADHHLGLLSLYLGSWSPLPLVSCGPEEECFFNPSLERHPFDVLPMSAVFLLKSLIISRLFKAIHSFHLSFVLCLFLPFLFLFCYFVTFFFLSYQIYTPFIFRSNTRHVFVFPTIA